jgi:putative transposase
VKPQQLPIISTYAPPRHYPVVLPLPVTPQSFFAAQPCRLPPTSSAASWLGDRHSSFLTLAPTLKDCSKRYERFCKKYRHHIKGTPKCHWRSRMLKRLVETSRSKRKRVSPEQQQLPFAFDYRLNQSTDDWQQITVRFRRVNGIRDGDRERSIW